ncbi:MAG: hypothetical protein J0I41_01640 [Filimonas sp.]|nr:hypothetical protein [Filimonas sp.]
MKSKILPFILIAVILSSCSAVYKSGQTPDDVYYSPARGIPDKEDTYTDATTSADNNYLRMKVRDQRRWSALDDYSYWNDSRYLYTSNYYNPYLNPTIGFSNYYGYYNTWGWGLNWGTYNPYSYLTGWYSPFYWNNWYNPCYGVVYYKNPRAYTTTSASAVNAFKNRTYNNSNNNYYTPGFNKGNNNSFGNLVGRVLSTSNTNYSNNNNNSNNKTWDTPARTFSNSNSAPSSSAGGRSGGYNSSGSGSAPARTRN